MCHKNIKWKQTLQSIKQFDRLFLQEVNYSQCLQSLNRVLTRNWKYFYPADTVGIFQRFLNPWSVLTPVAHELLFYISASEIFWRKHFEIVKPTHFLLQWSFVIKHWVVYSIYCHLSLQNLLYIYINIAFNQVHWPLKQLIQESKAEQEKLRLAD